MRRLVSVLVATGSVVLAACSDGRGSERSATTSGEPTTTASERSCTDLTDETIAALVGVLDRVDVDRSRSEDDLTQVLTILDADLRDTCGISGTGPALSEIVEFLAAEGLRTGYVGELALRTLDWLCSATTANEIRLTGDGDLECLGHGGDPYFMLGYLHFDGVVGATPIGATGTGFDRCEDTGAGSRTYELPETVWFGQNESLNGYDLRVTRDSAGKTTFALVPPDPADGELVAVVGPEADPRVEAAQDGSSIVFVQVELRDATGSVVGVLSGGIDCLAPAEP